MSEYVSREAVEELLDQAVDRGYLTPEARSSIIVGPTDPDPNAKEVAPGSWLHWGLYLRGDRTTGGVTMRTPADLARELTKIADTIDAADRHFRAQGEADAALHMAPTVRYNPLSAAVATAKDDIHRLIDELNHD